MKDAVGCDVGVHDVVACPESDCIAIGKVVTAIYGERAVIVHVDRELMPSGRLRHARYRLMVRSDQVLVLK